MPGLIGAACRNIGRSNRWSGSRIVGSLHMAISRGADRTLVRCLVDVALGVLQFSSLPRPRRCRPSRRRHAVSRLRASRWRSLDYLDKSFQFARPNLIPRRLVADARFTPARVARCRKPAMSVAVPTSEEEIAISAQIESGWRNPPAWFTKMQRPIKGVLR